MEREAGCDVGKDLDSGHGVGNGLDRGRVDVVVDVVDMPARDVPSAAAAVEGDAKMEHHQWAVSSNTVAADP